MAQSGEKKQKKYEVENKADVSLYLKEVCSTREPILEGHGCKDMSKAWSIFGFHRKYFVLYEGILLYYDHKSSYFKDRTKGLRRGKFILLDGVHLTKPETTEAPSTGYSFYLHAPHKLNKKHKMLLVFHSRRDRSKWCNILQAQNPSLLSPILVPLKTPVSVDHTGGRKTRTIETYTITT